MIFTKDKKLRFGTWLTKVPDGFFFTQDGKPDYRVVLTLYLVTLYPSGKIPSKLFLSPDFPSPTTIQRSIAIEAKRRKKLKAAEAYTLNDASHKETKEAKVLSNA